MGRLSKSAVALAAVALLVASGGAYALASSSGGTITVCVSHKNETLYKAGKCRKHDKKLSWNTQVPEGPAGPAGPQGDTGAPGPPGPVTGMAPSGITQRGLFDVAGYAASGSFFGASISFPLELTSGPTVVEVPWGGPNPDPTHCPGSADAPAAARGYLCLYDRIVDNVDQPTGTNLQVQDVDGNGGTVSPFGARLTARANTTGEAVVEGSWAVTAP